MRPVHGIQSVVAGVLWTLVAFSARAQDRELPQTGLEFLEPEVYAAIPEAAILLAGPLPTAVDLSADFPTPGDQGQQGSCVGWAVAYALKGYHERQERTWPLDHPDRLFSPAWVYNQIRLTSGCGGGTYLKDALGLLTRDGAATWTDFPYDSCCCSAMPSADVRARAKRFIAEGIERIGGNDRSAVKTHLAAAKPVVIGMMVDANFANLSGNTVHRVGGNSLGGHALVVVGYDDQREAFKVINSWGTDWGAGGFGWVSYSTFASEVRESYVVADHIDTALLEAPAPTATVLFETRVRGLKPAGNVRRALTTGNHHCSSNCQGEPTRTGYSLTIPEEEHHVLANPVLRCVSGPCHGWHDSTADSARIEASGRRAVAQWTVWSEPTTWVLSADSFSIEEIARFDRRVTVGEAFAVQAPLDGPAPEIQGMLPSGVGFRFIAGEPSFHPDIEFLGAELKDAKRIFRYSFR